MVPNYAASVNACGGGFRIVVRGRWATALLVVGFLFAACGTSSLSSASTTGTYASTAAGIAQPLRVAEASKGLKTGMLLVGSPKVVWVYNQSGRVTFVLNLTNKGTVPYDCKALQATQIPTKGADRGHTPPWMSCMGSGRTIAPGSTEPVVFFLPGNTHPPKDVVVLPYASNTSRMVWTVAACPTLPKSCLGRFQKLS
jgi:hypothetical protein